MAYPQDFIDGAFAKAQAALRLAKCPGLWRRFSAKVDPSDGVVGFGYDPGALTVGSRRRRVKNLRRQAKHLRQRLEKLHRRRDDAPEIDSKLSQIEHALLREYGDWSAEDDQDRPLPRALEGLAKTAAIASAARRAKGMSRTVLVAALLQHLKDLRGQEVLAARDEARAQLKPYRRGKKRGALSRLGVVLLEIIDGDPRKSGKNIHEALLGRARRDGIESVDKSMKSGSVVWKDAAGHTHRTKWRSIENSQLPRLRRLARSRLAPPQ